MPCSVKSATATCLSIKPFVLAWWTRLMVSHHLTWFINSLAHYWGEQTYSKEHSAVDNFVIAILTVGEGYHNFHHTFPADYRNGVRWYHFDPTKWTIWILSKVGLAADLRRFDSFRIKRRLLTEDRRLLIYSLRERAGKGPTQEQLSRTKGATFGPEPRGERVFVPVLHQRLVEAGQCRDHYPVRGG